MRRIGEGSWRIGVRRWEYLIDCALWIRAAERIDVPDDDLVPGPVDLAQRPALREVVARRWREATAWHNARMNSGMERHLPPSSIEGQVVREVEQAVGRRIRPSEVEFVLLPVRDDVIRQVYDHRYLVPERVYDGPGWAAWLRDLVVRIG